jgi:nitrogen fixation protein
MKNQIQRKRKQMEETIIEIEIRYEKMKILTDTNGWELGRESAEKTRNLKETLKNNEIEKDRIEITGLRCVECV